LDTFPGRGNFDQDSLLANSKLFVELLLSATVSQRGRAATYIDDVESLVDGLFCIEGESCINLSRHLAGNDLEDLAAERNQKSVECSIDFVVYILALQKNSVLLENRV
jgi:hypothetical protein